MTTETDTEAAAVVEETDERVALKEEAETLLQLTKNKVNRDGTTPCPGCNILVSLRANHCPHCESNIAAHNALMRESIRRLDEIRAELDGRHGKLLKNRRDDAGGPTVGQRFKRLFSGKKAEDPPPKALRDLSGPRLLDSVAKGDQLRVVECDGPWIKVKTRDSRVGWVYSTLLPDR